MAKGKKTGGRDWKKGHGVGRPQVPADLKEARKLTRVEFERVVNQFLGMPKADLRARLREENTTALESMVIKIMLAAIDFGDQNRLNFILDRTIGKIVELKESRNLHLFADLTDEQLLSQAKEAIAVLQAEKAGA